MSSEVGCGDTCLFHSSLIYQTFCEPGTGLGFEEASKVGIAVLALLQPMSKLADDVGPAMAKINVDFPTVSRDVCTHQGEKWECRGT